MNEMLEPSTATRVTYRGREGGRPFISGLKANRYTHFIILRLQDYYRLIRTAAGGQMFWIIAQKIEKTVKY
jgi:hypothetical protein